VLADGGGERRRIWSRQKTDRDCLPVVFLYNRGESRGQYRDTIGDKLRIYLDRNREGGSYQLLHNRFGMKDRERNWKDLNLPVGNLILVNDEWSKRGTEE
jgi:hypothetical protein